MPSAPRLFAIALVLFGVSGTSVGCSGDDEAPREWKIKFEDEFEGPAGSPVNPAHWNFDVGGWGWGNNQLEYNTAGAANAALDGQGHLAITAKKEAFGSNEYTSARIKTQDLFELDYGRFEARIKLPIGQGIWPAFWLLGADFAQVGWPACGEIDIMEYRGQQPSRMLGSLHGPGYSGGASISGSYQLPSGTFHDGFHVFAIDWNPERIVWLVDDVPYHTVRPRDIPVGGRWVFDHPFFMILNVAVGGNFVGSPNETTEFPQTMLVDWVRVLRLES